MLIANTCRRRLYASNTSGQLLSWLLVDYFCLEGGGCGVRCFCLGICEGLCINPIWEVGGPRLFCKKFKNTPTHPPPPNKKRSFPSLPLGEIWIFKVDETTNLIHVGFKFAAISQRKFSLYAKCKYKLARRFVQQITTGSDTKNITYNIYELNCKRQPTHMYAYNYILCMHQRAIWWQFLRLLDIQDKLGHSFSVI